MRANLWIISIVLLYLISDCFGDDEIRFENDEEPANEGVTLSNVVTKTEVNRGDDGYCTYQETKKKLVTVSVRYTEMEKVYTRCRGYYFKKCLVEKPVAKVRHEQKIQEYQETVRRCCDGYAEGANKRCLPVCEHSCVFANCTSPNTCSCYSGYQKTDKPNICEPSCGGCTHGKCMAPNICFCNPGYNWDTDNSECVPICDGNCVNGKCIEPEKCECDEGYTHHATHSICIPHCKESCVHGLCIETDKCECDFGYHFANGSQNISEPFCELSCKNAKCVEPNVCECHDGYTVADDNKPHECHCGMYCAEVDGMCHCLDETQRVKGDQIRNNISSICTESNCQNGICLTPFECDCYDGFEKDDNNICVAANETYIDDPANCNGTDPHACSCVNGICSTNHTCVCVNGFKMSDGHTDLCEPHCTDECVNGFCINPDSCECDSGYTLRNGSQSHCYPICAEAEDHDGCINGTCVAPDTCECDKGFEFEVGSNHICIPLPYTAEPQSNGMHWALTGIIPAILFIVSLVFAAHFIHKRKTRQFSTPTQDDEASEPITEYLNYEM